MLQVSKECEKAILALAPKHIAVPNAPNTLKQLQEWARTHRYLIDMMPVYDGGSENTIFSCPAVNHAFRAWHDSLHLEHNLGFGLRDEFKVAHLHVQELRLLGIDELDCSLIFNDVAGQAYYYHMFNQYVENQQDFHQFLHNKTFGDLYEYKYKQDNKHKLSYRAREVYCSVRSYLGYITSHAAQREREARLNGLN